MIYTETIDGRIDSFPIILKIPDILLQFSTNISSDLSLNVNQKNLSCLISKPGIFSIRVKAKDPQFRMFSFLLEPDPAKELQKQQQDDIKLGHTRNKTTQRRVWHKSTCVTAHGTVYCHFNLFPPLRAALTCLPTDKHICSPTQAIREFVDGTKLG